MIIQEIKTFEIDGKRIRIARAIKGWTLSKLEEVSGVRRKTIADAEKGLRNLRMETFKKLMDALEQDIEFFKTDKNIKDVI